MAELDRPESEDELMQLLPGANTNRIGRALRTLRSFHLIEVRTGFDGKPLLGLHPLIREFVRSNFPIGDREKYVGKILNYLDQMIAQFKMMLEKSPSYQILEYWTRKADLQISFGQFERATSTIDEISHSLTNRGYIEEMVRISTQLFEKCDWAVACLSYRQFDSVFSQAIDVMVHTGDSNVEAFLKKYENSIPGMSTQYILLCNLRCYFDWYEGRFESAVVWGERGERLKENSSVDTSFSCKHNLALARRDVGELDQAIEDFLEGQSLEFVVTPGIQIEGKNAPFYGNIGRCMQLKNKLEEAMVCYVKSAKLLEQGSGHINRMNRGYVRLWIAELLLENGEMDLAATFLRASIDIWDECAPPLADGVRQRLEALATEPEKLAYYLEEEKWRIEGVFSRWLDEQ